MPNNAPIRMIFAGLPVGYCFTTPEQLALDITKNLSGFVPGQYNFFNYGSDEPAVEDRDKPWFRLNIDDTPDRWYVFALGAWVSPHPTPATDDERRLWVGTENDLWSYDGGDGSNPSTTPPTDTTGAMWEVDTDYAAKFPLFPGTLPNTTVVAVGGTGGEDTTEITLTSENLPPHRHDIGIDGDGDSADEESGRLRVGAGTEVDWQDTDTSNVGHTRKAGGTDDAAVVISKSNLPPYKGIYLIKRTARQFYTA